MNIDGGGVQQFSFIFFFSSRRRHTRWPRDWSSDVCSSDLCPSAPSPRGRRSAREDGGRARALRRPRGDGADGHEGGGPAAAISAAAHVAAEIGRASCRERDWIEVGGGSVESADEVEAR